MSGILKNGQENISRNNWILFPLVAVASLRVSLNKEAQRVFTVLTKDPRNMQWIEQGVSVEYDAELGHPNPTDEEVLMGLIDFSMQSEHGSRELRVGMPGIMALLGWRTWGQYERRVDVSLKRWSKIKLTFEKGVCNEQTGVWEPYTFPVFSKLESTDGSYVIEWSEPVYASLKTTAFSFNLAEYQQFRNAIARRIYQLTHTQLAEQGSVELSLREFAEKDIRLHAGYSDGHIRRKLERALNELESKEYLKPADPQERFPFRRNGQPAIYLQAGVFFDKRCKPTLVTQNSSQQPMQPVVKTVVTSGQLSLDLQGMSLIHKLLPVFPAAIGHSTNPVKMAGERAVSIFWESLAPESRQKEEQQALSRATAIQRELLEKENSLSRNIREDLLRDHAIRLMVSV